MPLEFTWDSAKAQSNWRKHRVTFQEAATIFGDPLSLTIPDPQHSQGEERFVTLGNSSVGSLLVVVHLDIAGQIQIISARKATSRESRDHEEEP